MIMVEMKITDMAMLLLSLYVTTWVVPERNASMQSPTHWMWVGCGYQLYIKVDIVRGQKASF